MEDIKRLWAEAPEGIIPPNVYYLVYKNKYYVVVDDNNSIVYIASKEYNILAVARSKLKLTETQGVQIYYVEDNKGGISPLKIVSCSLNTIKNKNQKFVLDKIVPKILNA